MNFGTGFMYPIFGTNHYCTGSVSERQRNKDSKLVWTFPRVEVTGVPIYGSKTYGWKMISTAQHENGPHECRKHPMLSTASVRLFRITNTIPRTLSLASKWPSECHRNTCVHCPMSMSILYKATAICWIAVCNRHFQSLPTTAYIPWTADMFH